MGIKNLNVILRKYCPDVFETIHISEFAFKKVAIDTSLFLCKYKAICGDKWLPSFIKLVSCLRRNQIHCVFIYDSGAPIEKEKERAQRVQKRVGHETRLSEIEEAVEHYLKTNEVREILVDINNKKKARLLGKPADVKIDMKVIDEEIEKVSRYIIRVTPEDFDLTRELFDILNVPYYKAPLEAETMCADLCKRGLVDAVISEDTDVMAYSAPIFLTKLDTFNDNCVKINHQKILEELELTEAEFLDLCIMLGTDYNKNIAKIGAETSYKYIKKYKSIEEIESNLSLNTDILNYKRGREIFRDYEKVDLKDIPYCGHPDFGKLEMFIQRNNIQINLDIIKKDFDTNVFVFE